MADRFKSHSVRDAGSGPETGGSAPKPPPAKRPATKADRATAAQGDKPAGKTAQEIGGPKGPEPTRYGDWEIGGRCIDF